MGKLSRVFITGASGFIGGRLIQELTNEGVEVVALSRSPRAAANGVTWVAGNSTESGEWQRAIAGCDAVVNLAGEPIVGKRWSDHQKQVLKSSRVETTKRIVEAIGAATPRPRVLVSASAIGYYPKNEAAAYDETAGAGTDFLADICREWEEAARPVEALGTRLVLLRIGTVLGLEGGALAKMIPPFKLGVGGPLGDGLQFVSWIHLDDLVAMIRFALVTDRLTGPVNGVAPNPVTMNDLANHLGKALNRPALFPVPGFVLKVMLGESAGVVLDGQRVLPHAAEDAGFSFRFPNLDEALTDLIPK